MTTQSRSPQQQEGGPRCMCAHVFTVYTRVYVKEGGKGVRGLTHPLSVAVGGSRGGKADTVHQSGRRGRHRHPHLLWFLTASQPPQTQPDSSRRSRIARKQDSTRSFFFPFCPAAALDKRRKHFWVSGETEQEWREKRGSATQNSKREDEGDNKKGKEAKEESERRIKRCKAKAWKHQRGRRRVRKEENETKQKEEEWAEEKSERRRWQEFIAVLAASG